MAKLGVGLVGYAFMGAVHSQAWRTANKFFDLPIDAELSVLCGRDAAKTSAAAAKMGWSDTVNDWRDLLTRDDVHVIDVCTPGSTHAEISIAALEAGKHVICEKPLANTVAEAEAMAAAAAKAAKHGVYAMVGFTYRRTPALALMRQLVQEGRLGTIRHVRAQYLQDWLMDPTSPLTWRLDKKLAGAGALGDIGAHIIDASQFVLGEKITGVSGILETFVKERPVLTGELGAGGRASNLGGGGGASAAGDVEYGPVTVDDATAFTARFEGGAIGSFEASRFATGRKNGLHLEINGSDGSLIFDFEDMNVLQYFDAREPAATAGYRRIIVNEAEHPYVAAWWPPGHGLGYEHGFTHQVVDFLTCIGRGEQPQPSFDEGLAVQRVIQAVEDSAANSSTWQSL
ncbi:Gfo/Idh/MocA family oxidoreductase [Micrococcales bacterium 31B]|nr:Gfo/Idh/MocA family oxidoreductase [Micrococcales bacterium 31B]